MAYNFLPGDRDQPFLLPPDLCDWLPEGHFAWFVLEWSTNSTSTPSTEPTATTAMGIPPAIPNPARRFSRP